MITTTDPGGMTAEERRLEVAGLLAGGLLRCVRAARTAGAPATSTTAEKVPNPSQISLDLPSKTRLSVAHRPAG